MVARSSDLNASRRLGPAMAEAEATIRHKNIGLYNFSSFSEATFRFYTSKIHYQDRMRHSDYEDLCMRAGFRIVEQYYEIPSTAVQEIGAIGLNERFKRYEADDLMKIHGHFVLRRADGN